jgi:hypothetical protein
VTVLVEDRETLEWDGMMMVIVGHCDLPGSEGRGERPKLRTTEHTPYTMQAINLF